MKITGHSTRVVDLPRPVGPLGGGPGANIATFVTLKIQTDEGVEGIGYAGFASNVLSKALKEAVDGLAGLTVGDDPMMIEAIQERLLVAGGGGAPGAGRAVAAGQMFLKMPQTMVNL